MNSPAFDGSPTVSADETELFFTTERKGNQDLFVSTRPSKEAAWSEPVNFGAPIDDPNAGAVHLERSTIPLLPCRRGPIPLRQVRVHQRPASTVLISMWHG